MCNTSSASAHSVYIHIPFCRKRCSYCDFNTYAGIESLLPAYVNALCQEIVKVTSANSTRFPVHTVFLGGGTPSLLSPTQMEHILQTIQDHFNLLEDAEISIEANPGTIVENRLRDYHAAGVNRISFGMQSANDSELQLLHRIHSHAETIRSFTIAREAGFENINLDLIYNLPGQTVEAWLKNLQTAIELDPEHISLYSLTIEEGTLLHQQIKEGKYLEPDDDAAADMMESAVQILDDAGYLHYEISNWAKKGYECRHNKQYWKNRPYFGFGAGAHGLINNIRTINEAMPVPYIEKCSRENALDFPIGPATIEHYARTQREQIEDYMILNLRLLDQGVNRQEFEDLYHKDLLQVYPEVITQLTNSGHLEWAENQSVLRLSPQHFFIANQVLVNFLFDEDQ